MAPFTPEFLPKTNLKGGPLSTGITGPHYSGILTRVTRVIKNSNLSVKKLLERGVYTPDMFSR